MKKALFGFGFFVSFAVCADVFQPIAVDEIGADKSRLVDTDVSVEAAFVADFGIDGDSGKGVWRSARTAPEMTARKGKALATDVRVLYSARALYVAATMKQPMELLTAKLDQDDLAVYEDDNFEVFLFVPGVGDPRFIHITVNANGNVYDARDGRTGYRIRGMKVKVRRSDDGWAVEMRMPFDGIPIDRPFAGDFIGIRFCRTVNNPAFRGAVPPLTGNAHNRRADFAKLVFLPPAGSGGSMAAEARAYRDETLRKRFYERYDALKKLVALYSGSVVGLDRDIPIVKLAFDGVRQLRTEVREFEERNSEALTRRELVPEGERAKLYAVEAGFARFAADKAYLVWPLDVWDRGSPLQTPPVDYSTLTNIVFEQAGNEREIVGLSFSGLLCARKLDLRLVTHGAGRGKSKVLPDAFEVYEEKFLRYDGQLISGPLIRAAGNFITVAPGAVTRVWIVFDSGNVSPGDYSTHIDIKPAWSEDVVPSRIDVRAKVWNFSLPKTRDWPLKSFFWGPNQYQDDEIETLRLMHSRHITHGWTKSFKYWYGLGPDGRVLGRKPDGFKRELAETANDEFFREAKRLGMRFVMGWNSPRCWQWYKTLTDRFRAMGFQYEDFVFKALIADEFKKDAIARLASAREEVKRHLPEEVWFQAVYLSTPPPSGATIDDIEKAGLPEFYKMWTVISSLTGDPKRGPETIRRLRAKGCSVWDYHCGLHMHTRSALGYYRNSPRKAYLDGLDGTAMWHSGIRRGDDGYDVADGPDDGVLWSGPDGRFTPSKNFEAYCEGLEDVAYLDRLRKELGRMADKGLKFPEYERLEKDFATHTKKPDQAAIDAWRLAVGRAIDALTKKGK